MSRHIPCGLRFVGAGRSTGTLSTTVCRSSSKSISLAPATARPTGTPDASVSSERLTPRFPRPTGLGPDFPAFDAFVERIPAPAPAAGDVVVMDNLSSHKGPRVRELVEAAGAAVLDLPPYSPDPNPMELAFAKLKQLMRSAAHRTAEAPWADVWRMLDRITPADAAALLRHDGYTLGSVDIHSKLTSTAASQAKPRQLSAFFS